MCMRLKNGQRREQGRKKTSKISCSQTFFITILFSSSTFLPTSHHSRVSFFCTQLRRSMCGGGKMKAKRCGYWDKKGDFYWQFVWQLSVTHGIKKPKNTTLATDFFCLFFTIEDSHGFPLVKPFKGVKCHELQNSYKGKFVNLWDYHIHPYKDFLQ